MTERNRAHNGRDRSGHFRVKREDVDSLLENPDGARFVRDDVRLGGAVADTGARAGESGRRIARLIEDNVSDVARASGNEDAPRKKHRR
jgi:hypothetical protein